MSAILVAAVLAGGGVWLSGVTDPFRNAAVLDVPAYVTSANSLQGNTFRLEGEVLASLAWSPSGRLISIGVEDGKKAVPVLLPTTLNSFNIQKGQKLRFLLEVEAGGILRAKKLAML